MIIEKKIMILKIRRNSNMNINDELLWFGKSLGLFGKRDKNKTCYRMFVELLKNKGGLTSDDLAFKFNVTRATIIHHLKKLINSGIVINSGKKYFLRIDNLSDLIDELENDLKRSLEELKKSAEKIDKSINKK